MTHVIALLTLLAPTSLWAATILSDFGEQTDIQAWHDEGGTGQVNFPVSREERWATSGKHSLCFRTPQWKTGMAEWPTTEFNPTLSDWSGHDRLVLDVTNPTEHQHKLFFFITDSDTPTRKSVLSSNTLPPRSYQQVVVRLEELAQRDVSLADIRLLHFFTERPPGDMEVYIDRLALLRPDEPLPTPAPAFVRAMVALQKEQLEVLQRDMAAVHARIRETTAQAPLSQSGREKLWPNQPVLHSNVGRRSRARNAQRCGAYGRADVSPNAAANAFVRPRKRRQSPFRARSSRGCQQLFRETLRIFGVASILATQPLPVA